jgi:hypothetical protein
MLNHDDQAVLRIPKFKIVVKGKMDIFGIISYTKLIGY